VAWLEDLLLVLGPKGHSVIDIFVAYKDLIDWLVLAHWVDVFLDNV
jgi:hypothetical protein